MSVKLEDMPEKTTMLESIVNFFISSAHADEMKGIVRIDLPVKEDAKGYVVRIYKDKNLVFEEKCFIGSFKLPLHLALKLRDG